MGCPSGVVSRADRARANFPASCRIASRDCQSIRLPCSAIFSEPRVVLRRLSCLVRNRRHGAGNVPEFAESFNPSSRPDCLALPQSCRAGYNNGPIATIPVRLRPASGQFTAGDFASDPPPPHRSHFPSCAASSSPPPCPTPTATSTSATWSSTSRPTSGSASRSCAATTAATSAPTTRTARRS